MSTISLRSSPATLAGLRPGGRSSWQRELARVLDRALAWHERARQRRQLQSLSDHMLHDIGLGRADVEAETAKPFWQP